MDVEFQNRQWPVEKVLSTLRPAVTPERLDRIQSVVAKRRSELCVVMENIFNRGNSSAVMRSMEAFGYYQIHHVEIQSEYKESNRVSQGAEKWLIQNKWSELKPAFALSNPVDIKSTLHT